METKSRSIAGLLLINMLCSVLQPVFGVSVNNFTKNANKIVPHCVVVLDNSEIRKNVGSVWVSSEDPCLVHACEFDDNQGAAYEKITKKNCGQFYCDVDSDLQQVNGTCCGECVRNKCRYKDNLYKVGETWKDKDNCLVLECIQPHPVGDPQLNVYQKACPPVREGCPAAYIQNKDCCSYCVLDEDFEDIESKPRVSFIEGKDTWTEEFYRNHECNRECRTGTEPMICHYRFVIEWYQSLSKACYECPNNTTDCTRPHCIPTDGISRSITVANRMMPGPAIEVCENDTLVVDVHNDMLGDTTTIHWHGIHQKDTPYMDGVPHVTQCPISPHAVFRYTFKAVNPGTHFWHSHTGMQRGDGLFGALVVRRPRTSDPHAHLYDFDLSEHKMLVQDWLHETGVAVFSSHHHSRGDNKPRNLLINGHGRYYPGIWEEGKKFKSLLAQNNLVTKKSVQNKNQTTKVTRLELLEDDSTNQVRHKRATKDTIALNMVPHQIYNVKRGFRYRFRIINGEYLNCPIEISVDKHNITIISSDGYDLAPVQAGSIVTYSGERWDFILEANQTVGNYWVRLKGLMDCSDKFTSAFQVAILHYEGAPETEPEGVLGWAHEAEGIEVNSMNQGSNVEGSLTVAELRALPYYNSVPNIGNNVLKPEADFKFFIYYDFYEKDNPIFHTKEYYSYNDSLGRINKVQSPQLNHISLKYPSSTLLSQRDKFDDSMFCNETSLAEQGIDCRKEYCYCHHVLQVPLNAVVEIIFVDEGVTYDANHPFHLHGQAFRVLSIERLASNVTVETVKQLDKFGLLKRNLVNPPVKDTVTIPDGGYTIIRFQAYNPGYWVMHCHLEFHAEIGMAFVLKVGSHEEMLPVPKDFPACHDYMPDMKDARDTAYKTTALNVMLLFSVLNLLWFRFH